MKAGMKSGHPGLLLDQTSTLGRWERYRIGSFILFFIKASASTLSPLQIPVHHGKSFRCIADSIPVIAATFRSAFSRHSLRHPNQQISSPYLCLLGTDR